MNNRKQDRGYYKPKSYRFSIKTQESFKSLCNKIGSQEKALALLLKLYKHKKTK